MEPQVPPKGLLALLRREAQHFFTMARSDRPWHMPIAAAAATGFPLLTGAYFGHMDYGQASSLGGLIFLYLSNTPLASRMVTLMVCAFGMTACYTLGVISHFVPVLMMPVLAGMAILVLMISRFYGLGMPGGLFFIMAASIGAYSPLGILEVPLHVGLVSMGSLLACLIAFFYSLYDLRTRPPGPVPERPAPSFDFLVFDPVVIGLFVGVSLALAQLFQLHNAYWVPVSCLAVIQGVSLRAVWNRQIHRLVGTALGLALAWGLLMLPLDPWSLSLIMMGLTLIIETLVVRHYAFAVVFITPLTILLVEAAQLGRGGSPALLIEARLFDTVLGCLVGLVGGYCLHSPRFRSVGRQALRRVIPERLLP